jgi:VCBS repeat-containing protein
MSWDDVSENIHFWQPGDTWDVSAAPDQTLHQAFTPADQKAILDALQFLYNNSGTAQEMIDEAAAQTNGLRIFQTRAADPGIANEQSFFASIFNSSATIGINVESIVQSYYLNNQGYFTQELLPLGLAHELSHAVLNTKDPVATGGSYPSDAQQNDPNFNFDGNAPSGTFAAVLHGAVGIEDKVASELDLVDAQYLYHQRVSYLATVPEYDFANDPSEVPAPTIWYRAFSSEAGISFSQGAPIDIVRFGLDFATGEVTDDLMDMSTRTDGKSVLAFGFSGNDTVLTASGNDFLYGGSGNDILSGGGGTNFLDGGVLGTDVSQDGIDTATYANSPNGAVVLLDGGVKALTLADKVVTGKKEITVTDNGFLGAQGNDGVDHLYSIEKINGVRELDISSFDLSGYGLTSVAGEPILLWVAGTGSAKLDISVSGYTLNLGATSDPNYKEILQTGGTHTGIAITAFSAATIHGGGDNINFGSGSPITSFELAGIQDKLDLTGTTASDSTTVLITGGQEEIDAGAGSLSITDSNHQAQLVLAEHWVDYSISGDKGTESYTLTAKDGSTGPIALNGIGTVNFGGQILDGQSLLNQAPTSDAPGIFANFTALDAAVGTPDPNYSTGLGGATVDANIFDQFTYALMGSGSGLTLASLNSNGSEYGLTYAAGTVLDFDFWRSTIASVYGTGAMLLSIDDLSFIINQANSGADPDKTAALAQAFAGTPYVAMLKSTDANGASLTSAVFPYLFYGQPNVVLPQHATSASNVVSQDPDTKTYVVGDNGSIDLTVSSGGTVSGGNNDVISASGANVVAGNYAQVFESFPGNCSVTVGSNSIVEIHGLGGMSYQVTAGAGSWVDYDGADSSDLFVSAMTNVEDQSAFGINLHLNENLSSFTVTANPAAADGHLHSFLLTSGAGTQVIDFDDFFTRLIFNDVSIQANQLLQYVSDQQAIAAGHNLSVDPAAVAVNANTTTPHAAASLSFADLVSGTHSVSVSYTGSTPQLGALSASVQEPIGASGAVSFTYDLNQSALATAPKGNSLQTYQVVLADQNGHSVSKDITVSVAGLGQTTSFTDGASAVAVSENSAVTSDTADGSLAFLDTDLSDVHVVSVSKTGTAGPDGFSGALGTLTASINSDSTNVGTGQVGWHYSVDESLLATLKADSTYSDIFNVELDDGMGGTTTQTMTFHVSTASGSAAWQTGAAPSLSVDQSSDYLGTQTLTGRIFFTDANAADVHTLSSSPQSLTGGSLAAAIVHDTTGGGQGEIDWTYTLFGIDTMAMSFGELQNDVFGLTLSDQRGGQINTTIDVAVHGAAPTSAPAFSSSPSPMAVWAGGYANYASGFDTFTDADTRVHHTVSVDFAGSGTPFGTLTASLTDGTYGSTDQNPTGSYSLLYTADPAALNALQDGQTLTETWHVTLNSDFGLSTEQDQTVVIQRQNGTAIDTANIINGTVQAGQAPSAWDSAPGGFLFTDGNALDTHAVTFSFKSSSTGGGPLGAFSTDLLYDSSNSPIGEGVLVWNYDASQVHPSSATAQAVVETWTVNLDDGHGGITSQDVQVTIDIPAEQAPVVGQIAASQALSTDAPTSIDLLSTSSDPNAAATISLAGTPTVASADGHSVAFAMNGSVITIDPSQFAYLPRGQSDVVSIGYNVTDGTVSTHGTDTITITGVEHAPSAMPIAAGNVSPGSQPVPIDLLQTAQDADGDALSVAGTPIIVSSDGHGVASSLSGGILTVDPSQFAYLSRGQSVDLSISYGITDGIDQVANQATLTVTGSDHGPSVTSVALASAGQNDGPVTIDLLQGASDSDSDALTVVSGSVAVTAADGHSVAFSVSGSTLTIPPTQFAYLGAGESDALTISFSVSDGALTSAGSMSLTVNGAEDAPTASPIAIGSLYETAPVQHIDLLSAIHDIDAHDTLSILPNSVSVTSSDGHAVAATLSGGILTIDPFQFDYLNVGQSAVLTVAYQATDGTDTIANTASLTVQGTLDNPIVPNQIAGVVSQAHGTVVVNSIAGASSPDGGTLSLVSGSASATSSDGHAVTVTAAAGQNNVDLDPSQFAYLALGQAVTVTIGYDVKTSLSSTSPTHGTATMVVVGTDDAPTVVTPSQISVTDTSAYDTFAPIEGHFSASSPDGQSLTWSESLATNANTVTVTDAQGRYELFMNSANENAVKSGSISYVPSSTASDPYGGHASETQTISFTGTDDAPQAPYWSAGGSVLDHAVNGTAVGTLKAIDIDASDTATWSLVDSDGGRFALASNGNVTVANGSLVDYASSPSGYDIVVKDTDSSGLSVQQTVHVAVIQEAIATLTGTSGNDTLSGTSGNDVIAGLAGNDTINAGAGDDIVMPGTGIDHSDGGTGTNTLWYGDSILNLTADLQLGTLSVGTGTNFQNFTGGNGNDVIYGTNAGGNVLIGNGGNDIFHVRGGGDTIDGGAGTDYVYFDTLTADMTANLQTQTLGGGAAGTTVANIEGIVGGSGNDTLTGFDNAPDYLAGGAGNDILIGGAGADTEDGGPGHDIIYGSLGADTITDLDDAVFDYSQSPTAVALIWGVGGNGYTGYGGYADGDKITTGYLESYTPVYVFDLTPHDDVIKLQDQATIAVNTGDGDDVVWGSDSYSTTHPTSYTIDTGGGFDTIHPGASASTVEFGGTGVLDYNVVGAESVSFVWAEPGGTSAAHVYGGTAGAPVDYGASSITGNFGTFIGSAAGDTITGNSQANIIVGNGGYDTISAGGGDDHVTAAGGLIHGGDGNDSILLTGGSGLATSYVYGDAGNDTIVLDSTSTTNVAIHGGDGDDVIDAHTGSANTIVYGDAGADTIRANLNVTVSYDDATAPVSFVGQTGTAGDAAGDLIVDDPTYGAPKIVGSNYGDSFTGMDDELHLGTGNNTVVGNLKPVYGNTGNDTFKGTSGADTIHTGGGTDFIFGTAGNDQFYFDHPGTHDQATLQYSYGNGADTIHGFTHGLDTINIARLAGDPDPTVTTSVSGSDTTVHIAWDASHQANIDLAGVQLTNFIANQDYHLV